MSLYNLQKNELKYIKEVPFKLEKDIQSLCEENMTELLGCDFVKNRISH